MIPFTVKTDHELFEVIGYDITHSDSHKFKNYWEHDGSKHYNKWVAMEYGKTYVNTLQLSLIEDEDPLGR